MKRIVGATVLLLGLTVGAAQAGTAETFVEAPGPKGALKGTLLSPAGRAPVVLLVPGSGNVDRDENAAPMVKAASLKLLA